MGTQYFKHNDLTVSNGNSKIGRDTIIFNMGSARTCPSARMGFCKIGAACYARKAEKQYPACLPYRQNQENYWKNNSAEAIWQDFYGMLTTKKRKKSGKMLPLHKSIKFLRVNESGDFWGQDCIEKLDFIAERMSMYFKIKTYTYTARKDLYFKDAKYFMVKGSSNDAGNNGMTIARKDAGNPWYNKYQEKINGHMRYFIVCPGDCTKCNLCKENNGLNIVFNLH